MVTLRFIAVVALAALAPSASAQQVELLDFYLPTCGPCHAMAPVVDRLEAEGVRVRRVDGSRDAVLAGRLQIDSYPTFVVVADGREVGRRVGITSYEELRALVASAKRPGTTPLAATASRADTFAAGDDWGVGRAAARPPIGSSGGQNLLDSSVRLTVDDPAGRAFGTGTIVDARQGEALVVTCAHLFRDANDKLLDVTNRLSVETYRAESGAPRVAQRVSGQLISHDFEADVALVAIRLRGDAQVAPVAGKAAAPQIGDRVQSVGCDLGADPTVREHQVVDLNRYLGPPNTEASGAPIQGRSGGGLFDSEGRLIGVCNFADESADEGIYAGLASIHAQLDRIGLTDLYDDAAPANEAVATESPATPREPRELRPIERTPVVRGQNPGSTGPAAPTLTATEQATLSEIRPPGEHASVTVVIHPENGRSEVLTLDSASPEFVAALRRLSDPR